MLDFSDVETVNHDEENFHSFSFHRAVMYQVCLWDGETFPLPIPCQVDSTRRVTTQSTFRRTTTLIILEATVNYKLLSGIHNLINARQKYEPFLLRHRGRNRKK